MRIPNLLILSLSCSLPAFTATASGPYPPAAGDPESTAVHKDNPSIITWAMDYRDYIEGEDLETEWKTPERALGPANGTIGDVVSLGNGGKITMIFDPPIANGPGYDFAVFANGFSDGFLELAFVEVSSDGENFIRFPSHSLTPGDIGAFDLNMDPTHIDGLAGKYRVGYGTPFDLETLPASQELDLNAIRYVRLVDIIGDGDTLDSQGNPIYDPYRTQGSAGFDLDAIGAMNIQLPKEPVLENAYVALDQLWMEFAYAENSHFEAKLWSSSDLTDWQPINTEQSEYSLNVSTDNGTTAVQVSAPAVENRYYRLSLGLQ